MKEKHKKTTVGKSVILVAVLVILYILSMSFYIVDETENVVIKQFGKPIKTIREPGLYIKLPEPFQTIKRFDDRIVVSESAESEVLTSDKKNLVVDYFAIWKIEDPLKFMQTVVDENGAKYRISDIVYSELRRELGLYEFKDIISTKRAEINRKVVESSREKINTYGIKIIDVRIRRINFPYQNLPSIFDRMSAERSKIANKYRSEGEEEALKIMAETDKLKTIILAESYNNASSIKGEGDAQSTKIYGKIYEIDPEFYQFVRTLETYNKILLSDQNMLIVSTDTELFKYLKQSS